jgi:glycerophosphoryl diester phosphodiesterase
MHKLPLPTPKHGLIGHRGTAGLRPENTCCSFEHAAKLGLNWIEFDVQLSKDLGWVVIHDAELNRTTNGTGLVNEHAFAELIKLDAGAWFNPPYPQQTVPSLLSTLQLAAKLKLCCNVEIKGAAPEPELHATQILNFIQQHQALLQNALFSSFDLACLILLRKATPQLPIGYLVDDFNSDTIEICKQYNFQTINCDVGRFTEANLQAAQQAEIPLLLYTVNEPATAELWLRRGVYAVFTDLPDLLLRERKQVAS